MVLLNDSVQKLKALFLLTIQYCDKFHVKLVAAKTQLLVFTTRETELKAKVELASHRICVDGVKISPSAQATHVGVVRSAEGNGPNILARLSAHRRAVYAVLSAGLAKGHRANPAASLRLEIVFGVSVLLSGLASLVLTNKEENLLAGQFKVHIQRLLRLHQATPDLVVFLLAGCLRDSEMGSISWLDMPTTSSLLHLPPPNPGSRNYDRSVSCMPSPTLPPGSPPSHPKCR